MRLQERMHCVAQLADTFSVDDPEFVNSTFLTGINEFKHHVLHVLRAKRVQIQDSIHRQLYRIIRIIHLKFRGYQGIP